LELPGRGLDAMPEKEERGSSPAQKRKKRGRGEEEVGEKWKKWKKWKKRACGDEAAGTLHHHVPDAA
jgi:hypothetical protein